MCRFLASFLKATPVAISIAVLSGSLTASTQVNAGWYHGGPGYWGHPYHHFGGGYGMGWGGAAVAGGLVLGALAANAAAAASAPPPPPPPAAPSCRIQPKQMVDPYGNKYFTQVKVCD